MNIDIDSLTYDELVALNHRIVERLKFLDSVQAYKEMVQFFPGDQVSFRPPGHGKQIGTLVRLNKKTVSVITESGQKWNISPHLLSKVKNVKHSGEKAGKVINLPGKE